MREININIEGYNVNGICVGCLNYNRKMFYCNQVKEYFKLLGNIDVPDGLTIQVCWECLANVRSIKRFQDQILKSYETLMDYSRMHTFLNSPMDLSRYASEKLTITNSMCLEVIDVFENETDEVQEKDLIVYDVKIEQSEEFKQETPLVLKEESDIEETDYLDTVSEDPVNPDILKEELNTISSEEDISLLELTKKRTKKKEKKKNERDKKKNERERKIRRHNKLRNLPENSVVLVTMEEKEMWEVRKRDLESQEFNSFSFKCDNCIVPFSSRKLYQVHMAKKHKPKPVQCDVCQGYFRTAEFKSSHKSLHLVAFKCTVCEFKTTQKKIMLIHVQSHSESIFTCNVCKNHFSTKSKLLYHKNVCKQEKPQCDCCGKVFANKVTLRYHLKAMSGQLVTKQVDKLEIECKDCNKIFKSRKSYRAHAVIHDNVTYPCPKCGAMFLWRRNLARHLRNHDEIENGARHECRPCGKIFASKDSYNNHMRMSKQHIEDHSLPHSCEHCGKKFASKWCLIDHVDWEHLNKIKYQCSICLKAFKTAKILVAHNNNVHGRKKSEPEGSHLCDICGKYYKTVKRLKGHVWAMHTHRSTGKNFKCSLCPATFAWQTSIYKHMKIVHEDKKKLKWTSRPTLTKQFLPIVNRISFFDDNEVMQPPHNMSVTEISSNIN